MKGDYLWDKTGKDEEVERLEKVLSSFRGRKDKAPKLPDYSTTESPEKLNGRRHYSFGIAAFACLALLVFGIGLYQVVTPESAEFAEESSVGNELPQLPPKTAEAKEKRNISADKESQAKRTKLAPGPKRKTVFRKRSVKQRTIQKRKRNPRKLSRKRPGATKIKLTAEEKYAYDQLMLGLSITSENLKIVRDKVKGDPTDPAGKEDD